MVSRDYRVTVPLGASETLDVVEHAAELWGARWSRLGTGGRLELPVHAGVRRGTVTGRLWTEPDRGGTALVFRVETSDYSLKHGSVAVLAVGGLSALALTFWPLYPPLLAAAPLALVFTVLAWLLISSRLQSAGIEDFLDLVATGGRNVEPDPSDERPTDGAEG